MRRFLMGFLCVILALGMAFSAAAEPVRGAVQFSEDGQEQLGQPLAGLKIGIDPGHQTHANTEREAIAPGSSETKAKVASGHGGREHAHAGVRGGFAGFSDSARHSGRRWARR